MYIDHEFSPGGDFLLLTTLEHPFSYLVPGIASQQNRSLHADGRFMKTFSRQPLLDNLPVGFMATWQGKRNIHWRADKPATLAWVEALDNGDPEVAKPFRDELFQLEAPFTGKAQSLMKTIQRFAGVIWGNDSYAVVLDRWWNTRNSKTYLFNPSDSSREPHILFDRDYQDTYSHPGIFQTEKNELGSYILKIEDGNAYLFGEGFTPEGQFPFIDALNLKTLRKKRIYQSDLKGEVESLVSFADSKKGRVITRLESPVNYPNYYIRDINQKKKLVPLTDFENPFKSIEGIHKEVISYRRSDGVTLTGTLYLPADYDKEKKEKLPMIMWAYPTDYKDKNSAGQNTQSQYIHLSILRQSHLLGNPRICGTDDAAFPLWERVRSNPTTASSINSWQMQKQPSMQSVQWDILTLTGLLLEGTPMVPS